MAAKRTLPPEAQNLPSLLRELAENFGLGVALQFANDFGGREITVPTRLNDNHPIAQSVGRPVLRWLMRNRHPGEKFDVPIGPASSYRKLVTMTRKMVEEKAGTTDIVRRVGVTTRTIRRHRAAVRDRQPDLFAPPDK